MKTPLFWATRPAHQNAPWQQQLAALGETTALPLLEIIPVSSDEATQAVKGLILDLDHFQHVLFVSQNAVKHGFEWFDQYWPQLPVGIQFYAVGSKTAEAVREHHAEVIECGEAMNSEALLALPSLQQVAHDKVLICRGQGGRPTLAQVLEQRGAKVSYCELYQRALPNKAKTQCAALPLDRQHIIPLFSGDTLQNLILALPSNMNKDDTALIVPAQRVADTAQQAGFKHVTVAANASQDAMLAATNQCLTHSRTL